MEKVAVVTYKDIPEVEVEVEICRCVPVEVRI